MVEFMMFGFWVAIGMTVASILITLGFYIIMGIVCVGVWVAEKLTGKEF